MGIVKMILGTSWEVNKERKSWLRRRKYFLMEIVLVVV